MSVDHPGEHELEPEHGLPEPLPAGERVLWQGAPDWRSMAVHSFHLRKLTIYFGVIVALRATTVLSQGGSAIESLRAAAWLMPAVLLALGLVALMAWLSSRTTVYTITDRRVVMRVGIVLSLSFNLPYRSVVAASLRQLGHGCGDIPIVIDPSQKIAFVHLWPHARPWRVAQPEPMLRSVPDAQRVAALLSQAWAAATGLATQPASEPTPRSAAPTSAARPRHAPSVLATH
jgi:hypothetical protein